MNQPFDAILFDLDGVLMTGNQPLPGVIDMLQELIDAQIPFLILSNKTMEPRTAIVGYFAKAGLDLPIKLLQTPPAAVAAWLGQQGDPTVALFVTPHTTEEFAGLQVLPDEAGQGADFVIVGDLAEQWTYQKLNQALRLLLNGGRLVALGMGRYWSAPDGMRLDTGAFVSALAHASGQEPIVIGKPSPDFFRIAIDWIGRPAERVAMVGDDVVSDVGAAQKLGMKGILVQTGKYRPQDLHGEVRPDWVLPDATGVLPLLRR